MWTLIFAGGVLALVLIYLARLDGSIRVRRSLEIDAPAEAVFAAVADLRSWPEWSPWLLHDAEAELEYGDPVDEADGYYSWQGKIVGAGRLTHEHLSPHRAIQQRLDFVKPFKSTSLVRWEFTPQDGGTLASWEMDGGMPFLSRFMAPAMTANIERDFTLGLARLGGYVNPQMPHPRLEFGGFEDLQGFSYRAIPCQGNLRQVEAARRVNIETLRSDEISAVGLSLTLYQRFDPAGGEYCAEHAIPVADDPSPSPYPVRDFSGGRYIKLTLDGDLGFLPLGWHALASHCRMRRIRVEQNRPALEIYRQDPAAPETDATPRSTLYLPVRQ